MIDEQNQNTETACLSCGLPFKGKFCNNCGEKRVKPEEHTLKFFLGQLINALTFADTKVWKTLRYLFLRPGKLPLDFIKGKRKPYIAPLPLFLLVNILYFLISPVDTFNSYFQSQIGGQPYSNFIVEYGMEQMRGSGLEEEAFKAKYNSHSSNISKTIILLIPIMLAFPLSMLYSRKKYYFFDHLMFSISYMTYILLGIFLILFYSVFAILLLMKLVGQSVNFDWNGPLAILILLVSLGVYLFFAVKNFYQQSWLLTSVKTFMLLIGFIVSLLLYRFVLFFVTIWTL